MHTVGRRIAPHTRRQSHREFLAYNNYFTQGKRISMIGYCKTHDED